MLLCEWRRGQGRVNPEQTSSSRRRLENAEEKVGTDALRAERQVLPQWPPVFLSALRAEPCLPSSGRCFAALERRRHTRQPRLRPQPGQDAQHAADQDEAVDHLDETMAILLWNQRRMALQCRVTMRGIDGGGSRLWVAHKYHSLTKTLPRQIGVDHRVSGTPAGPGMHGPS